MECDGNVIAKGRIVQSTIKLIQDKREFWFQFFNFSVRFCVDIFSFSFDVN